MLTSVTSGPPQDCLATIVCSCWDARSDNDELINESISQAELMPWAY